MANYVNIILDTIGPSGVSVLINGDADKAITTAVTLTIGCSDADTSGYQMKIWGTADVPSEADAAWETYQTSKNVTLSAGDDLKTVYVKVRDDVWNESATASDTITLYEKLPSIIGLSVNKSKLSLVDGMNLTSGSFSVDENIDAIKIMIVQNANDAHNAATNIAIPVTHGSKIETDNGDLACTDGVLSAEQQVGSELGLGFVLYAQDISSVVPGDGVKIVKVFVRSAETGSWSV
ncbi:MAG: hypothetical protein IJ289_05645 [Clostridia bacterium]|nr:hypothetical protein [Clostridia bacterium]